MSSPAPLLGPVFALAAWTMAMLVLVAYRRLRAGFSGRVHPREFALGESPAVPAPVALANRNYMNLMEMPVLFYVACVAGTAATIATPAMVALAWLYVGLRVVHSVVHVTYNRIIHRFAVFALSNVVLVALWALLGQQVFARTA